VHEKCKISGLYVFQGNAATHPYFDPQCSLQENMKKSEKKLGWDRYQYPVLVGWLGFNIIFGKEKGHIMPVKGAYNLLYWEFLTKCLKVKYRENIYIE